VPAGYLVAQPVAIQWQDDQEIVWPTAKVKADGMKFTTEEFIDSVIDDVSVRHKLDKSHIFTLSWSSSYHSKAESHGASTDCQRACGRLQWASVSPSRKYTR
jgi:hypothetical protein